MKIKQIYTFHEVLGKGAFGVVLRGVKRDSGEEVAIKCIKKAKLNESDVQDLW